MERANRFLAFDALGNPAVAVGTSGNLNPVSAFMDALHSAADASSARTQLGSTATGDALFTAPDATAAAAIIGIDEEQIWLTGQVYG